MHVYLMKNILHEVTTRTLAYINSFFKKYNTLFTKPVKKIIYPEEIQGKENIVHAAKHNIEQQQEEYCSKGESQRSHHFSFTLSKYNYFSMLNLLQKI